MKFAMASAAVLIWATVLPRLSPLLLLQRGATYARAAGFQAADMAEAAWGRLSRWPEHCERARREI